jgi:hypothetical protein
MHASLDAANSANVVLFTSGKGTREKMNDLSFLQSFKLNPNHQLIVQYARVHCY